MAVITHGQQGEPSLKNNQSLFEKARSWVLWLLSVLLTSAVISHNSLARYFISEPSPSSSEGMSLSSLQQYLRKLSNL